MTKKSKISALFSFSAREVTLILAGGAGLFLGLPNPLLQLPLLVLLFPFAISCLALESGSERRAVRCTLAVTLLGGGLAVHWVVYPMINFGGVPLPLAIAFMLLLVAVLSVYYIIYSLLLRFYHVNLPGPLLIPAGALTWGALEYLRGWFLTGVTWCDLSTAMIGWPVFAQGAALVGIFGLSALYALAALCFLPLVMRTGKKGMLPWAQAALGLAIIITLFLYGLGRMNRTFDEGKTVVVAQVQGNIDQAQKWQPAMQAGTVRHYLALSRTAVEKALRAYSATPGLLVWPETAMPFYFQQPGEMSGLIRNFIRSSGVPLVFGVPARGVELGSDDSYNRVWLLDAQGADAGYYDKEHLVPFGEYIPKGVYVPFASEFLQGHGFTPGANQAPLRQGDFLLGVLICYEAIFPELAQARVTAGANLLINVSNDAWFSDSPAPRQHLQLAAMRCIEQGRYMIRSTNTGISAMIDPAGRVHGAGPLFEDYVSAHEVRLLEERTFFNRHYGTVTAVLAYSPFCLIVFGLVMILKKRAGIKNATNQ